MAKMPELPPVSGGPSQTRSRTGNISFSGANSLAHFSEDELLLMRSKIDALLPARRLKDVNLEVELVRQLAAVHRLQAEVLADDSTPANQKAQCAGQVANVLSVLSKLQVEVYSSERLKKVEAVMVETINLMPNKTQAFFFAEYEARLEASNA